MLEEVCRLKVVSHYNKPKKVHTNKVVSQDYICTKEDKDIIEKIKSQPLKKVLVHINGAFLTRELLECLFHKTAHMDGDVISAYINLIRAEEHLRNRKGGKVFLENTFISSILKRDGDIDVEQINTKQDTIQKRVDNYLKHDMIFSPINIKMSHWYLAVVNAQEREIHVLDSLSGAMHREDLKKILIGLQRQISIVAGLKELKNHMWKDLQVAEWTIIEKITRPMQTDGYITSSLTD
ncbi:hypothetical protein GQ55_4G224400 [Panicum hallii var. hallii]|uniref:Ubiquitin-like protease family profile domain-containing protein n=1 Tax=Panicum hallii var. hallii TaxID=1504633 RepID=A0A2T7DZE3_9POAL|nr:hypothetical protein GQ55_4G224400 [Panicum hallii var. hallii]